MKTEHKVSILLVDDDPSNLIALEAVLESLGQNLVTASSGMEALRRVLDEDFAVILLDVQMPEMSGIETAALIRERDRSRTTPIIFLTGSVKTNEMMFKGYSAGAVDYLMKPVVSGILRAKVEVFVELGISHRKLEEEVAERMRVAAEISGLNMALEQRNSDLMAANADLESFGYSVSHDLRMPLRHIRAYISLLEESASHKLNEAEQRQLKVVRDAAQRMSQLIDDLLALAKLGTTQMRRTEVDMRQIVDHLLSEMQPDYVGRQIAFNISTLPKVSGDPGLLRQVWINLLSNSIKYTRPREHAVIDVSATTQDEELVFQVHDNGVGFDMKNSTRLFGIFQRMHTEQQFEGTGVGLANVRRIVQRHGGRTWAESQPDVGTTIYFTLPTGRVEIPIDTKRRELQR